MRKEAAWQAVIRTASAQRNSTPPAIPASTPTSSGSRFPKHQAVDASRSARAASRATSTSNSQRSSIKDRSSGFSISQLARSGARLSLISLRPSDVETGSFDVSYPRHCFPVAIKIDGSFLKSDEIWDRQLFQEIEHLLVRMTVTVVESRRYHCNVRPDSAQPLFTR